MGSLAIEDLQGEYASYEEVNLWAPKLVERKLSPDRVGQLILANHRSGRFSTEILVDSAVAGSVVRLKVSGVTPLAALAILGGRLNNGPPEPLGRIVVPFKDSLDVLARIPEDAEAGTYAFFAQQWEVGVDEQGKPAGLPAYPGGSLIYVSKISTLEVRPHVDEGKEVTSLLEEWLADESGYDEETWPKLKQALDQDRPSDRKLFID